MMRVWGSPVIGNGHKRFTSSSLVTHTHTTQIPHIQTPPLPPKSSPSRPVYKAPYTTSKEDPSNLRKRIPPSSARGSLRPPRPTPGAKESCPLLSPLRCPSTPPARPPAWCSAASVPPRPFASVPPRPFASVPPRASVSPAAPLAPPVRGSSRPAWGRRAGTSRGGSLNRAL